MILKKISYKELIKACKTCGRNARKCQRDFAYYLPEVARRELHRKYKFAGIHEFAGKVCGMSHKVADQVLSLFRKFEEMPQMWEQVRVHGWSKLRVIACVVEEKTQNIWIENLKCTKSDLEELVRIYKEEKIAKDCCENYEENDEKFSEKTLGLENSKSFPESNTQCQENTLNKGNIQIKSISGEKGPSQKTDLVTLSLSKGGKPINSSNTHEGDNQKKSPNLFELIFKVDSDTDFQFREFKQKIEKQTGKSFTMGEILKLLFEKLNESEKQSSECVDKQEKKGKNKQQQLQHCSIKESNKEEKFSSNQKSKKKIPKQEVYEKQNGKCILCNKPIYEYHHPGRIALNHCHEDLVGVCRQHHRLAHFGHVKNEQSDPQNWELSWRPIERDIFIESIDQKFMENALRE